jgi:hypothetical protein
MARRVVSSWGRWCISIIAVLAVAAVAHGAALDERGDIKLGVRAYTAARIGTQGTDQQICYGTGAAYRCGTEGQADPTAGQSLRSLTFPVSAAGHLRQNRFYVEAELDHDLQRLLKEGFGPLTLLNDLPFKISKFKYHLTFRGEADGIYDYGPAEYRTAFQYRNPVLVPEFSGHGANIGEARQRLRKLSVHRERLFQAYLDLQVEKLFIRFGRQILSWGETDVFRLLDNINPLDASFGGFLVPLDERRVPLDMLRLNYHFGEIGPLWEVFVEAYAAIDDSVGFEPGVPAGSPWALPNLGAPSATLVTYRTTPRRTFEDTRGGVRVNFAAPIPGIDEANFTIAHYYTYLDVPEVQTFVTTAFPLSNVNNGPLGPFMQPDGFQGGFLAIAEQSAPRVQITGASTNFYVPIEIARALMLSGQPTIRSELAYFAGEPRQSQSQLDPFLFAQGGCNGPYRPGIITDVQPGSPFLPSGGQLCRGGRRYGDSWNFVLGIDTNQFIRWLNPNQSIFITTQFFYKHLKGAVQRETIPGRRVVGLQEGEVLPVPRYNIANPLVTTPAEPVLIHQPVDQFLNTILLATSYMSGQINPSLTFAYDWSGALVTQPQVTLSRDPFRFTFSYSLLYAAHLKGASGISLLRDRDNVLFQFEYVI